MVASNLIAWNELMIKSHLSHVHQTGPHYSKTHKPCRPTFTRMEEFAEVVQDGETHHSLNNYSCPAAISIIPPAVYIPKPFLLPVFNCLQLAKMNQKPLTD